MRQNAENKKREAEWLREQAGQDCVLAIDHRLHGNLAEANPILRQVEHLISEADQLDREANEHLSQIEKNNKECQTRMAHVLANVRFRSDLMQSMEGFQTQLTDLRRQLQEKKKESEEKQRQVFQIRNEEDSYGTAASYKEEEAVEDKKQSEEAEREAQRIEQEIEQLSKTCELLAEGSGLTPATPELDSAMGVRSWIIPSKETMDSERRVVYRSDSEQVN